MIVTIAYTKGNRTMFVFEGRQANAIKLMIQSDVRRLKYSVIRRDILNTYSFYVTELLPMSYKL